MSGGIQMRELEFPFDATEIMLKKKQLKRKLLSERKTDRIKKKIAVLGGQTTRDIVLAMELFLLDNGIEPVFYESEFNQYYQEIMFENLRLQNFQPDIIYLCTTNRNIKELPSLNNTTEEIELMLENEFSLYKQMWQKVAEVYQCPIIQNNFELPLYRLLGNRDAYDVHGVTYYINRLNALFAEYAGKHKNIYLCDVQYISADYGIQKWSDPFYWHMYKYAVAVPAIPYLAQNVANIIKSIFGRNKKGFVLDLDNTLWGGIVGDDGAENLQLGSEDAIGQAYIEFQRYVKAHKDLGIVLTINSKNDIDNAMSGIRHPDGVLKEEDFTIIKANWRSKDQNFQEIAEELNLLSDSLVFVDDNPAERLIVTEQIEGVRAPEIEDVVHYGLVIDRSGFFETTSVSDDDLKRNAMYRSNAERIKQQSKFADYGEFLNSLRMKATITSFESMYFARIAQLTNKSNQFNLTTKRYSQCEIEAIATNKDYITLYGKLEDKFGDNGVVSLMIGRLENRICHIELWIMSCRVLKRDMEYAMFDKFVKKCKEYNVDRICGYYYPTAKNKMVENLYEQMGFLKISENDKEDTVWEMDLHIGYVEKNRYIQVED